MQSSSLEHQVFVALQRLASGLGQEAAELLKSAGLSTAQFNVLRVLRGARQAAEDGGLPCGEIAERLISRDPDITRLLDRLEAQGLVTRSRSSEDRRVVMAGISDRGLEVLGRLDAPMAELHRTQLGHLGDERLRQLLELVKAASRDG